MLAFRIKEASGLLGVSDDTLRREAADELGLEPGMFAVAAVKATNVTVEILQTGWQDR
jgi:molybdopterin-binding protein